MQRDKLGLDVGGVIIDSLANKGTDTAFSTDNFLASTAVNDVYIAVARLVALFGRQNVHILSKCGKATQEKTKLWLEHNSFYELTKFSPANVHFCTERAHKAPIAKELGLTHFVDDRADVLGYMLGIVLRRYLFGPQPAAQNTTGLIVVETWMVALEAILRA